MAEAERALPAAAHEPSDIGKTFIWAAFALLLGALAAIALVTVWIFPESLLDRTIMGTLPVYPSPRLQPSPRADMESFYAEEMQRLNSAGWTDRTHGVVHMPIEQAMRDIARVGIPGWPASPGSHR